MEEKIEAKWPRTRVGRVFLLASPEVVAPQLLGKILAVRKKEKILAGRIVEVEVYFGPHHDPPDPAAHAFRGPTERNRVLFGEAGHAYVYSIYGRYFCMNISCEAEGLAGCVLLRALEPLQGMEEMVDNRGLKSAAKPRELTSGPSRLCQALGLTRESCNGLDLLASDSPLQLREDGFSTGEVWITPRIGIREATDWPLRFALAGNACVSGPKSLNESAAVLRVNATADASLGSE